MIKIAIAEIGAADSRGYTLNMDLSGNSLKTKKKSLIHSKYRSRHRFILLALHIARCIVYSYPLMVNDHRGTTCT